MRSDPKTKILLKEPKIKVELWPRTDRDSSYEKVFVLALTAELIFIDKDFCENRNIMVVIAG